MQKHIIDPLPLVQRYLGYICKWNFWTHNLHKEKIPLEPFSFIRCGVGYAYSTSEPGGGSSVKSLTGRAPPPSKDSAFRDGADQCLSYTNGVPFGPR